jgi:NAD(P)-dependent dehydrogenase (short-subunit alcohol dehydrogenase family)
MSRQTRAGIFAGAIAQQVAAFGIKVQTINPGAYLTVYNETMADTAFRWLDDAKNFNKRDQLRATFDALLASQQGHLDPQEMINRMIAIVPADTGKVRNISPQFVENMLKDAQAAALDRRTLIRSRRSEQRKMQSQLQT